MERRVRVQTAPGQKREPRSTQNLELLQSVSTCPQHALLMTNTQGSPWISIGCRLPQTAPLLGTPIRSTELFTYSIPRINDEKFISKTPVSYSQAFQSRSQHIRVLLALGKVSLRTNAQSSSAAPSMQQTRGVRQANQLRHANMQLCRQTRRQARQQASKQAKKMT